MAKQSFNTANEHCALFGGKQDNIPAEELVPWRLTRRDIFEPEPGGQPTEHARSESSLEGVGQALPLRRRGKEGLLYPLFLSCSTRRRGQHLSTLLGTGSA